MCIADLRLETGTSPGADSSGVESCRRALRERHRRGIELINRPDSGASFCDPDFGLLPDSAPAEIPANKLTASLLRGAVLRDGCLLVRGLVEPSKAATLATEVERAFNARDAHSAGTPSDDGFYEEFAPDPGFRPLQMERAYVASVGVWTADSPRLAAHVVDLLESAKMRELLADYFGEDPVLTVNKWTLRVGEPGPAGPWHQDGAFLGEVRTLNIWLALTPCGELAPSLDVVPQRIGRVLKTGTDGAMHNWSLSPHIAENAANQAGPVRLRFKPGDALLFDEFCVHRPGSDPGMPDRRFAVETWFFSPAHLPDGHTPLGF